MSISEDSFTIDIVLRHPARSPESISQTLSLVPKASRAATDPCCKINGRSSYVLAILQTGNAVSEYESALTNIVVFLDENAAYWPDFTATGGEVEIVLNHTVSPMDEPGDKCFEIQLAPEFLNKLASFGMALRIQGWQ